MLRLFSCLAGIALSVVPAMAQSVAEPTSVEAVASTVAAPSAELGQPVTSLPAPLPSVAETPGDLLPATQCCTLPALTAVRLEIRTPINSKLVRIGDHFAIRLADPVDIGDVHLPAGIEGSGDVVHAAKSGFAGRPGELILAVRYLDVHGTHVPLRSLTFLPGRGKDQTTAAVAFAVAGGAVGAVIAMFITGGEVDIPVGTIAFAKTAAPVVLPGPPAVTTEPLLQQGNASQ